MENFGTYLVERGALTAAQLDAASQSKVVYGGRLGTILIESGYLELNDLERYLSEFLEIPLSPPEWLRRPAADALRAIPDSLATKRGVFPLRIEKKTLHVAMRNPRDHEQLEEVGFAASLCVVPYAIAEVRLFSLLEHHYGLPSNVRHLHFLQNATSSTGLKAEPQRLESSTAPESEEHRQELLGAPLSEDQELIDQQSFETLHHGWDGEAIEMADIETVDPPAHEPSSSAPKTGVVAGLEAALSKAPDRDDVSRITLGIARCYAAAAALFVVRGGIISGFRGDGEGIRRRLEGVLLPVESDSEIMRPAMSRMAFRGSPPKDGLDAKVTTALERGDVCEVAVYPILIRGHVANLLYADNGPDPLGDTSCAALTALAELVSRAYERLILERKAKFATPEPTAVEAG